MQLYIYIKSSKVYKLHLTVDDLLQDLNNQFYKCNSGKDSKEA